LMSSPDVRNSAIGDGALTCTHTRSTATGLAAEPDPAPASSEGVSSAALTRRVQIAAFAGFVGGYLTLLAWFKLVDVYHTQFSTSGVLVIAHNFFRALFVFYLFWIIYFAGTLVMKAIVPRQREGLNLLDELALNFFAGV